MTTPTPTGTPAGHRLPRGVWSLLACGCLALLTSGCLSAKAPVKTRLLDLGPPPATLVPPRAPWAGSLRLAGFTAASPLRAGVMHRLDAHTVVVADYHRWAAAPEQLVAERLRQAWGDAFSRVGGGLDDSGDYTVEGHLQVFERHGDDACLRLELALVNAQRQRLWQQRFDLRQPLLNAGELARPAAGLDDAARLAATLAHLVDQIATTTLGEWARTLP